jgi:hypothetical protein
MGDFTARLELPRFIPKEEILRKQVFDSEVVSLGRALDWTYTSDGEIKMIVKKRQGNDKLKTKIDKYEVMKQQEEARDRSKPKDKKQKALHEIVDEISPELLSTFSRR